jgi:hypothetical protein
VHGGLPGLGKRGKKVTDGKDIAHHIPSRLLTHTEMQFFSYTHDEREAVALARVAHLRENATHAEIEDAALKCFTAALENAGLKDSLEYVGGQRRDTLRSEGKQ